MSGDSKELGREAERKQIQPPAVGPFTFVPQPGAERGSALIRFAALVASLGAVKGYEMGQSQRSEADAAGMVVTGGYGVGRSAADAASVELWASAAGLDRNPTLELPIERVLWAEDESDIEEKSSTTATPTKPQLSKEQIKARLLAAIKQNDMKAFADCIFTQNVNVRMILELFTALEAEGKLTGMWKIYKKELDSFLPKLYSNSAIQYTGLHMPDSITDKSRPIPKEKRAYLSIAVAMLREASENKKDMQIKEINNELVKWVYALSENSHNERAAEIVNCLKLDYLSGTYNWQLLTAVGKLGRTDLVEKVLKSIVESRDLEGYDNIKKIELLKISTQLNRVDLVEKILMSNVILKGTSFYHSLVWVFKPEIAELVMRHTDPRVAFENSQTPLVIAIRAKRHDFVAQLLKYKYRFPGMLNIISNQDQWSLLQEAIVSGHTKTVEVLLENGADPKRIDKYGTTLDFLEYCYAQKDRISEDDYTNIKRLLRSKGALYQQRVEFPRGIKPSKASQEQAKPNSNSWFDYLPAWEKLGIFVIGMSLLGIGYKSYFRPAQERAKLKQAEENKYVQDQLKDIRKLKDTSDALARDHPIRFNPEDYDLIEKSEKDVLEQKIKSHNEEFCQFNRAVKRELEDIHNKMVELFPHSEMPFAASPAVRKVDVKKPDPKEMITLKDQVILLQIQIDKFSKAVRKIKSEKKELQDKNKLIKKKNDDIETEIKAEGRRKAEEKASQEQALLLLQGRSAALKENYTRIKNVPSSLHHADLTGIAKGRLQGLTPQIEQYEKSRTEYLERLENFASEHKEALQQLPEIDGDQQKKSFENKLKKAESSLTSLIATHNKLFDNHAEISEKILECRRKSKAVSVLKEAKEAKEKALIEEKKSPPPAPNKKKMQQKKAPQYVQAAKKLLILFDEPIELSINELSADEVKAVYGYAAESAMFLVAEMVRSKILNGRALPSNFSAQANFDMLYNLRTNVRYHRADFSLHAPSTQAAKQKACAQLLKEVKAVEHLSFSSIEKGLLRDLLHTKPSSQGDPILSKNLKEIKLIEKMFEHIQQELDNPAIKAEKRCILELAKYLFIQQPSIGQILQENEHSIREKLAATQDKQQRQALQQQLDALVAERERLNGRRHGVVAAAIFLDITKPLASSQQKPPASAHLLLPAAAAAMPASHPVTPEDPAEESEDEKEDKDKDFGDAASFSETPADVSRSRSRSRSPKGRDVARSMSAVFSPGGRAVPAPPSAEVAARKPAVSPAAGGE